MVAASCERERVKHRRSRGEVAAREAYRKVYGDPAVEEARVCLEGCRSFACENCGPLVGLNLRDRLLARYEAAGVREVGLITLTISDKVLAPSSEEQYEAIRDQRLVGEFVRLLRHVTGVSAPYFRICEFGGKSNRLHYHLMVDGLGRLPLELLGRLQAWCQSHLGTMDYKYRPTKVGVRYVCKYVTKGSGESLPDFVLDRHGFKFYSTSRGFWGKTEEERVASRHGVAREQRTLRVRLQRCGSRTVVLSKVIAEDGSERKRFVASLEIPFGRLMDIVVQSGFAGIADMSSAWPIGVVRWVDVEVAALGELLEVAAWASSDGSRGPAGGARGPRPFRLVPIACSVERGRE